MKGPPLVPVAGCVLVARQRLLSLPLLPCVALSNSGDGTSNAAQAPQRDAIVRTTPVGSFTIEPSNTLLYGILAAGGGALLYYNS